MLARRPEVLWRRSSTGIIALVDDEAVRLEPAASLVWDLLDEPAELESLHRRLAELGAAPPAPHELRAALDQMIERGVLVER